MSTEGSIYNQLATAFPIRPESSQQKRELLYPPGGLAVWLFLAVEIVTFATVMLVYLAHRSTDLEVFNAAQAQLSRTLGFINTLILIFSGFLVAQGVASYKAGYLKKCSNYFFLGGTVGLGFIAIKIYEYAGKITAGQGIGEGGFYSYYWGMTGFHFLHVLIGLFFLFGIALQLRKGEDFVEKDAGVEAGAVFWHMCDLIWILLFPLLYILI